MSVLATLRKALSNEAEFQRLAAPYRIKGHVYAQPLLNYKVKMGGEFVDLTTGKEVKLGYAKDRIRRQLEEDARKRDAVAAMPTAPTLPPAPGDATRPERAAEAIPLPSLPGSQPVLTAAPSAPAPISFAPAAAPVFAMDGGTDDGGASDSVVGGASGASPSSLTVPVLVGVGVLALILLSKRGKR